MNSIHLSHYDDSTWELPSFDEVQYVEKHHEYALVIPVINEGNRIQVQLQRIHNAELPVDVIVADGGSNDGSLDPDYMREVNVTAVLTKTGPGKLSSQLRMAYAWCIRQGYAGIITIDGNGKDGVEAVSSMVSLLKDGYDYVQGSRYLPGGQAENTPLERTIGNRLIHAPLLSVSGRHWYTDTTNGFRAYSAKYLLDPRVRPFRDVFQRYELLFYLTVRAGQIGMKVAHLPVKRRYPAQGKTPTKINGLSGKVDLFKQTFMAALGRFAPLPPDQHELSRCFSRPYSTILIALFFSCLTWLFEGYQFGHANHGQEIPPILAMIDPSLFSLDFAVQSFIEPGPRYFYYQLVASMSSSLDLGVDKILLVLKILSHFSFFFAVTLIIREVLDRADLSWREWSRKDILVAGVFLICCSFRIMSWGIELYNPMMVPSTLSIAIAIWSLYFAIRQNWVTAFLLSAMATIFQFLVGLFAGVVLVPALFLAAMRLKSWRVIVVPIGLWITPALTIYAATVASAQPTPESFNFLEIFGRFRVPHHWFPSTGNWYEWASDIMLMLSAVLSLRILLRFKQHLELSALLAGILVMAICGVIANIVFVEIFPITFIGKLQFQRIMPFGHVAAYLLVIYSFLVVQDPRSTRHEGKTAWLVAISLVLTTPSIFGAVLKSSISGSLSFKAEHLLFLMGLIIFALSTSVFRVVMTASAAAVLVLFNLPQVSIIPDFATTYAQNRYRPIDNGSWSGINISNWLRENTPNNAVIIIPPDWSENSDLLALYSRRSIFFSFKNVPYSDHGVWEWAQRAEALLGVEVGPELERSKLREHWRARSIDEIEDVARRAQACFLVDRIVDRGDINLMPVATAQMRRGQSWGLWQLEYCDE